MLSKKTVWDVFSIDLDRMGLKELKQKAEWFNVSYDYTRRASIGEKVFSDELIKQSAERLNYSEERIMQLLTMAAKERSDPEFTEFWSKISERMENPPSSNAAPEPLPNEPNTITIYSSIRAGSSETGITEAEAIGVIDVPEEYARKGYFALRVSGDSMSPDLFDGEIAIFKPINGATPKPSDILAIEVAGWDQWVVKYAHLDPSGTVQLISKNNAYPVREVKAKNVIIRGVLVESRRIRR